MNPKRWLVATALFVAVSCGGGDGEGDGGAPTSLTPAPTATPTATPTPTPTPTPLPALPSFSAPAPVLGPEVAATPEGAAPLGKARNPSLSGHDSDSTPVPIPEKCADVPLDRLNPADILRCSNEALLEAPSFRFVTQVQAALPGQSEPARSLESRGAYELDRDQPKSEYVAIYSIGSDLIERVDFRQVGDTVYSRVRIGASQSEWSAAPAAGPAVAVVDNVGIKSAVMLTAERGGMPPPGSPVCGDEMARLLPPDQSGGADYYVVEVFPATPHADGCGSYLVETHWVSRASLRPWRVVVETRGDDQASWTGQMVFSDYDNDFEIDPPPGLEQGN